MPFGHTACRTPRLNIIKRTLNIIKRKKAGLVKHQYGEVGRVGLRVHYLGLEN